MKTVSDLGREVKAKYRGDYDDMSDEEVGRLVKRKYPGDYDDYVETGLSTIGSNSLQLYDPQLENKIQQIWNKHEPGMGNVVSWWRRRKLDGQNRFLQSANEQQRLLIEQASMIAEAYAKHQRDEAEFKFFVARNVAEIHLMGEAAKNGMTIPDWSAHNRKLREFEMKRGVAQAEAEARVYEEQEKTRLRLEEHEAKKKLELHVRATEYTQDQENVDRIATSQSIIEEQERERLYKMYEERVALRSSNDPAKEDKLKALDIAIQKKESKLFG